MPHKVCFVKDCDTDKLSEDMKDAYEISAKTDDVSWMSYEEIRNLKNENTSIFVCSKFEGKSFNELRKRHFRIYGPRYVIYCNQKKDLVDPMNQPALTATMKGLVVCCTNVPSEKRLRLHDKIKLMGGKVTKVLTKETTHLVADQASSKKYHLAAALQTPIYTSEWINRCWQEGKSSFKHATDKCYESYRCPIFKGLSVTVSQISNSERAKIKDIIEKNGGHYAGCLKVNVTTHLILNDCSGDKFKVGKSKNIFCLKPTWVYDSVKNGYCADEQHYTLTENSTEENSRTIRNATIGSPFNSINTMSETVLSASKIDKTAIEPEQILVEAAKLEAAGQFLDGCKIVLSGFSPVTMDKLKKILNKGGATRFDQVNEDVTHVIMGRQRDEHKKTLLEGHFRPHVVSLAWLKESIAVGKTIDENPFYCLDLPTNKPISPFKTPFISKPHQNSTSQPSTSQKGFELEPPSEADNMADVFSQYLPTNVTALQSTQNLTDYVTENGMFLGLTFAIFGFNEDDRKVLEQFVTEFDGVICNDRNVSNNRKVDYNIVPLCGTAVTINAINTVTYFWLQSCIDDKKVHDISSHALYSPFDFDTNLKPLSECVVGLSQFENPERETIVNLTELLGAKHQDRLSKENRPNQDLLANTHLVTNQPSGKKYDGAILWGIPVVSLQWLIDCAKAGERMNESAYLIGNSKLLESSVTPMQNRFLTSTPKLSLNAVSDFPQVSIMDKSEQLPFSSQTPLKEVFKTPNAVRNDSFTAEDLNRIKEKIAIGCKTPALSNAVMQRLKSNEMLANASQSYSATPDTTFTPFKGSPKVNVRNAMARYDSPVDVPPKTKFDSVDKKRLFLAGVRKGLEDHIEQHGSVIPNRKLSIGDFEVLQLLKPLNGYVVVVSKKLKNFQEELNEIAETLGAKVRWTYDKKATHLIYEEHASGPVPKDVRDAQEAGKWIVSREWLYACRDQNKAVSESSFPYSYNPRKALDFTELFKINSASIANEASKSPLKEATSSRSLNREINKLNAVAEEYKRQLKPKSAVGLDKASLNFYKEGIRKPPPKKDVNNEQGPIFESVPVTWDNPACQPSVSTSDANNGILITKTTCQVKELPKILVSGLNSKEKLDYTVLVKRLGGEIRIDRDFCSDFTHLVTASATYTEKFIASVAKGLWVLKKSYLEACSLEGRFVDEEIHEMGEDPCQEGDPGSKEYQLAVATRQWRIKVDNMKRNHVVPYGAFYDWKVIVYTSAARESSFKRILSAGGAEIVKTSPPFSDVENVTHAFLELSNVDDKDIDFAYLIRNNVQCLKFEYITSYLFQEDNIEDFYIPEVKDYLQADRSSGEKRSSEDEPSTSNSKKFRHNSSKRR